MKRIIMFKDFNDAYFPVLAYVETTDQNEFIKKVNAYEIKLNAENDNADFAYDNIYNLDEIEII